jgi:hypothetical protein
MSHKSAFLYCTDTELAFALRLATARITVTRHVTDYGVTWRVTLHNAAGEQQLKAGVTARRLVGWVEGL